MRQEALLPVVRLVPGGGGALVRRGGVTVRPHAPKRSPDGRGEADRLGQDCGGAVEVGEAGGDGGFSSGPVPGQPSR